MDHSLERQRSLCWTMVLCIVTAWNSSARIIAAEPLPLGDQLQLFLDDRLIDDSRDVRRILHSPQPAEIAIQRDKPWEDSTMYDPVVIQDGNRYRMWYRANFNKPPFYTAYAESEDGIRWTKPSLGLFEYAGSKDNNIVWVGNHHKEGGDPVVWCVFKDENPAVPPEERYKATAAAAGLKGLQGLVSPDGIHWKLVQQEQVVPNVGPFDTHSISMWDAARKKYVVYTREFVNGVRHIRRAESDDFRKFPVPTLIKFLDDPPRPLEHLYKNAATPYYRRPDLILMFPKRFLPERTHDPRLVPGLSDIVFMFSYDGVHFDRQFREAFIRPGFDPRNWRDRAIEVGPGLWPTGTGEMSLYYMEHYRSDTVRIRRGVLRVDGLVSVQAGAGGGELVTKPFTFSGNRLLLNYSTSAAGSVRVEIQDAERRPIPGFTFAECPEIYGDEIDHPISWKGKSDLAALAGQPIRLKFTLQDADLFSLRFSAND